MGDRDVLKVDENMLRDYQDGSTAKAGQDRPVVLIMMTWPSTGKGQDMVMAKRLSDKVQEAFQKAVDAIHTLMAKNGMPDVDEEIKEGTLK